MAEIGTYRIDVFRDFQPNPKPHPALSVYGYKQNYDPAQNQTPLTLFGFNHQQ